MLQVPVTRRKFKCQVCQEFSRNAYPPVLRHIGEVHSFEPNFRIVCGLTLDSIRETCPATYTNYGSFRSHVYTKHRRLMNLHLPLDSSECNEFEGPHDHEENCHELRSNHMQDAEEVHTVSVDHDSHSSQDQITRAAALFILKTMEVHQVSQVCFVYTYVIANYVAICTRLQ